GKIGGAAQRRFAGGVLRQHVTLAYDIDADKLGEVLRRGRGKRSDKRTRSADKRVDPTRSPTRLGRARIRGGCIACRRARSDTGTGSADKRGDPMPSPTGLAREQIIDGFLEHFRARYDTVDSTYAEADLARARELVETEFGTEEWTARVPGGAAAPRGAGR